MKVLVIGSEILGTFPRVMSGECGRSNCFRDRGDIDVFGDFSRAEEVASVQEKISEVLQRIIRTRRAAISGPQGRKGALAEPLIPACAKFCPVAGSAT